MKKTIALVTALAGALAAQPATSQDSTEAIEARTAHLEARTALAKAKADAVQQQLDLLGLKTDATGKTELKDKGGEFEGWLLSSRAIETAAAKLDTTLSTVGADAAPLILLAGDEAFDLGLPETMRSRLEFLKEQSDSILANAQCKKTPSRPGVSAFPAPAVLTGLGALVGAFRTDTTISGFAGPDDARMVIAALAAARGNQRLATTNWIVPADLIGVPKPSSLIDSWRDVETSRTKIAACRIRLAGLGDKFKDDIATLDAQLANIDDFASKQIGASDGVSPLVRAAQIAAIADLKPAILRIYVEKAGGSILNRRNLWTALGFSAVGITGGAVIGWRVSDPIAGRLIAGGNFICRTQLTSMRAIQSGRIRASNCDWEEQGQ